MAKNQNNNVAPATQKTDPGAKKDALATALAQIEKQFGKGAVMKLGDNAAMQVDAISTGSIGLDLALGVGGVPRAASLRCMAPNPVVRPRWPCMFWPKLRRRAAMLPSSMWSTRWTCVCRGAGCGHQQPAGQPARYR